MGYINIGTKVGNGSVDNRYRIDYNSANIISADEIDRVSASIANDTSTPPKEILTITIAYKVLVEDQELLAKTITYTPSSSTRRYLEYDAPTYSGLFNLAIARANGAGITIQAPAVNEGSQSNTATPNNGNTAVFAIPANQSTVTTSVSV
jgi:hypothetical protein